MKKLGVALENCYGIKKLDFEFDFGSGPVYAIYAANGMMKSSLAQTFFDVSQGRASADRIFPKRACKRVIRTEKEDLAADGVVVIRPYDEVFGQTERTSTLLVDAKLRTEYEQLHNQIDATKVQFLAAMKEQSKSRMNIEREISLAFTKSEEQFYRALIRARDEVNSQKEAPLADVPYDVIFDEKVLAFLNTKDFKSAIKEYVEKYNELLAKSTYFRKGIFNYYNASTIAKNLADNGFFEASHAVTLRGKESVEITTVRQLEALITKEKEGISKDADLRKKYGEIEKLITKNANVREFNSYLENHEHLLPMLSNLDDLKENVWKSYFFARVDLYNQLIERFQAAEKRKAEIEKAASDQRTQWERVIEIFNRRFFVPFKVIAKNRVSVILGQAAMLSVGFEFEDGGERAHVERDALLQVLSTGEKKALYVLNIIFEVEARKKLAQPTLFIVDDIADSFDYKNKYAIIEYLMEISEVGCFRQIILTHNFDFFRTIESRFVPYKNCLMASKSAEGLRLEKATGIKNVFGNDWRPNYFKDSRKRLASIPFMRNIIEYTQGPEAAPFIKLTSLLHWRSDTETITNKELDDVYRTMFFAKHESVDANRPVVEVILQEANTCVTAPEGANFENKIVLAMAIRLIAERYMVGKIADDKFVASIAANQTGQLFRRYRSKFGNEEAALEILQRVILMTPESIHLNSFMYEPILDMSDGHLRKLCLDVLDLSKS